LIIVRLIKKHNYLHYRLGKLHDCLPVTEYSYHRQVKVHDFVKMF